MSQSNKNADFVPKEDKFKLIDDLSMLEILNLVNIGLKNYNFKQHVASDIAIDQKYLSSEKTASQTYTSKISDWTLNQKMVLNEEKSKIMIVNFTKKYKFSTRIYMNNTLLEIVNETKILGLILSDDLSWRKNTDYLITKANARMMIVRKLVEFSIPYEDLVNLYCIFIRSILEFNSAVWFSSISEEESHDLERVQKNVCRLILKNKFIDYDQALTQLKLETLKERRAKLALKFAEKCLKNDEMKHLFPRNCPSKHNLRKTEEYQVKFAHSKRLFKSAIPTLQRMLNEKH